MEPEESQEQSAAAPATEQQIDQLYREIYDAIDAIEDGDRWQEVATTVQHRTQEFRTALRMKYPDANRYFAYHKLGGSTPQADETIDRVDFEGADSAYAFLTQLKKDLDSGEF